VTLSSKLDEYNRIVSAWLDQAKKEAAAVQRLQKAVATGNVRDMDKLRQAAQSAAEAVGQRAEECPAFEFDAAAYLSRGGGFMEELTEAARRAGVRVTERDEILFSYPVTVRAEPDLAAARIDKKLVPAVRPETLAAQLKKLQGREPKSKPERFIEVLYEAYELWRARRGVKGYGDAPLTRIHDILTLLPGSDRDYTLLDFTRDIYFLDSSDIETTRAGHKCSLTASTASREHSSRLLQFVTRDGYEKVYASVKFTPPD
jgi:hypothetical protein